MRIRRLPLLVAMLFIALFLAAASTSLAQKKYAGSYNFAVAFTVGGAAGLCGSGAATVFSSGEAVITIFYPINGSSDVTEGLVSKRGLFTLDAPNSLQQIIYRRGRIRFASGFFGSPFGGGNFVLANYW